MDKCICNNCINLKPVIGEDGAVTEYVCEFGWPDESCEECSGDECNVVCSNYKPDGEEAGVKICRCSSCGKELQMSAGDESEGEIFCLDCYLKK